MMLNKAFLLIALIVSPTLVFGADADIATLKNDISSATSIKDANAKLSAAIDDVTNSKKYNKIEENSEAVTSARNKVKTAMDNALKKVEATDKRTADEKAEDLKKLEEDYEAKKANEQSMANKTLTAVTTAATGIGGMELAMGLSEQKADKDAANDMAAYIATMRCTYGEGKQVKAGPDEIQLPGASGTDLGKLRSEYLALAADLKERKTALGMKPGIESEEILDKASSGLYDDENVGIDSGAYASLYRAQMYGSEADQAKIDADAKASKNRVLGGAIAAGAGAVIGVGGNMLINGEVGEKLKKAINEKKVGKETQSLLKKESKALENLRSCLKDAGVSETEKLSFSNFYPSVLSVKSINCKKDLLPIDGKKLSNGDEPSNIKASDMFADSTDATEIYNKILTYINIETVSKLVGYSFSNTANLNTEKTNIQNKIKTSIESIQKKFDDAAEKDKEAANKAGISLGSLTDGDGLMNKSGIFSNVANITDLKNNGSSDFLSTFMSGS